MPKQVRKIDGETLLDLADLDRLILDLEIQVAPVLAVLKRLKRRRAALVASKTAGMARREATDEEARRIYAAWKALGDTRGAIRLLMEEFGFTERTILRRLERAGRTRDRAAQRERLLDNISKAGQPRG